MRSNTNSILFLAFLFFIGGLGSLRAQTFDISSGGAPTIIGAIGGSVTGSSSTTSNLSVSINFGELSPSNTSNIVQVNVPIAIRSVDEYKVTATVTGATNVNVQALQRADIGFGIDNLRRTGILSRNCDNHTIAPLFSNDPATSRTIAPSGRAAYPSSLNNISTSTTILSGPPLSWLTAGRLSSNAWIFDANFAVTPQFYASGTMSATITFTISAGPTVPCG
jgi:hypothetical protein